MRNGYDEKIDNWQTFFRKQGKASIIDRKFTVSLKRESHDVFMVFFTLKQIGSPNFISC